MPAEETVKAKKLTSVHSISVVLYVIRKKGFTYIVILSISVSNSVFYAQSTIKVISNISQYCIYIYKTKSNKTPANIDEPARKL